MCMTIAGLVYGWTSQPKYLRMQYASYFPILLMEYSAIQSHFQFPIYNSQDFYLQIDSNKILARELLSWFIYNKYINKVGIYFMRIYIYFIHTILLEFNNKLDRYIGVRNFADWRIVKVLIETVRCLSTLFRQSQSATWGEVCNLMTAEIKQ